MTFPSIELPRTLEMFSSSMNNGWLYCSPPPRCSNLHFALFSHYLDRKCEFYGILDERNGLDVVIETIPCPIRANIRDSNYCH